MPNPGLIKVTVDWPPETAGGQIYWIDFQFSILNIDRGNIFGYRGTRANFYIAKLTSFSFENDIAKEA